MLLPLMHSFLRWAPCHTPTLRAIADVLQFHKQLKQLVSRAATHPKMAALLDVLLEHFQPHVSAHPADASAAAAPVAATAATAPAGAVEGASESDDLEAGRAGNAARAGQADAYGAGRVIIFTNRRDSVQSIVEMLRLKEHLITARCLPDPRHTTLLHPAWLKPLWCDKRRRYALNTLSIAVQLSFCKRPMCFADTE